MCPLESKINVRYNCIIFKERFQVSRQIAKDVSIIIFTHCRVDKREYYYLSRIKYPILVPG